MYLGEILDTIRIEDCSQCSFIQGGRKKPTAQAMDIFFSTMAFKIFDVVGKTAQTLRMIDVSTKLYYGRAKDSGTTSLQLDKAGNREKKSEGS